MHMIVLPMCMSVCTWVPGPCQDQKRVLDRLELELQMPVSCDVGDWNPDPLQKQQVLLTTESDSSPVANSVVLNSPTMRLHYRLIAI